MKILMTGGCGFLGSNLAKHAIDRGYDVMIFDDLSRKGSELNLEWLKSLGKFKFIKGDIRNSGKLSNLIKNYLPDIIFHLAGQVAMTTSIADPRKDFEINVLGTLNLLEAVRKYSPRSTVIYSSTNKAYGNLEQYTYRETKTRYICVEKSNGFDEDTQLSFHSPYGCSKGAADQYMLDYARIFNLNTVVFRHSSMYGGRQFATYDQGWIGWFCHQAIDAKKGKVRKPFTISGNGKQVRDVLHAEDMVALYFAAINKIKKIRGQAFNIGGGMENSFSILELLDFLEKELDVKLRYKFIPWRSSDQKVFVADMKKFKNSCKWSPKIDKFQGVRKMIEWVSTNG